MITIATRINYLLTERHMSLNQLSVESGIPYMTLKNIIITGGEQTRLPTLRKIADYFGITLDTLINGSPAERAFEEAKKEKAPAHNEQELSEVDTQIIYLLPFVPETVKAGVLQILASTVDLTAAAESANRHIEQAYALRAEADDDEKQEARNG